MRTHSTAIYGASTVRYPLIGTNYNNMTGNIECMYAIIVKRPLRDKDEIGLSTCWVESGHIDIERFGEYTHT